MDLKEAGINVRGEKILLAVGLLLGAGYTMEMGKERRGISGAIIRKLTHDQSPPSNQ